MDAPVLSGPRLTLRPLTEMDATNTYASWLNDPVVNQYLETRQVTLPALRQYIREKATSPNAILFGIFWNENGKHIGNIKLEPIDLQKKEATLGILIGDKDSWGKGVATEATNMLADYAFGPLGLRALTLGVIAEHAAAIRVYEKCGFVNVGVEKDALNHDGVLYDKIVMRREVPAPGFCEITEIAMPPGRNMENRECGTGTDGYSLRCQAPGSIRHCGDLPGTDSHVRCPARGEEYPRAMVPPGAAGLGERI